METKEAINIANQAKKELKEAKERYHRALQECIVPGLKINFKSNWGRKVYPGTILEAPSYGEFVKVRNEKTKKEFYIHLYDIEGMDF